MDSSAPFFPMNPAPVHPAILAPGESFRASDKSL